MADSAPSPHAFDLKPFATSTGFNRYSLDLLVKGAHCGGCLAKIEKGLERLGPVNRVRMNLSTRRLHIEWAGASSFANEIGSNLIHLGFTSTPYDIPALEQQNQYTLHALLKALAVAGFAAMNVMMISIAIWFGGADMSQQTESLLHWVSAFIALPAVAYSGQVFFKSAWGALRQKTTNMDVPISLAIILACGLSIYETVMQNPDTYFDAAVMLLFLLLIGRYLDARLRFQTGEVARQLAALQVSSVTRINSQGQTETVSVNEVTPGDILSISKGQRIPVNSVIQSGRSNIDMQIATGETLPVEFGVGDTLYSGTINLTAPLIVEVIAKYTDSFLSEIATLIEIGQQKKGRFVRLADKAARAYVPIVHALAFMTFLGWYFLTQDMRTAALNAIAVLIITCPCALGLAVPAVQIVASGRLFKQGVLLKSGDALERLSKTQHVIFDKTGTLTQGRFRLSKPFKNSIDTLQHAGTLARHSNHPLSRALHSYSAAIELENVSEIAGSGLRADSLGIPLTLGSAAFVGAPSQPSTESQIWFRMGDAAPICFEMFDVERPDAKATIDHIHALGLTTEIVSGDRPSVVEIVAKRLGVSRFAGAVTPQEKMKIIDQRSSGQKHSLMVGDGINDAPALARAYCSAALASASDISRASADIILQGDRLSTLPAAIKTAQLAQKRVYENLALAIGYNLIAIPLAVFGYVNPLIAAVAMSLSSLLVTLNALRMTQIGDKE